MSDYEMLRDIHDSFECAQSRLSDEFLKKICDECTEDRVQVVHRKMSSFLPVCAAVAALMITSFALMHNFSGRGGNGDDTLISSDNSNVVLPAVSLTEVSETTADHTETSQFQTAVMITVPVTPAVSYISAEQTVSAAETTMAEHKEVYEEKETLNEVTDVPVYAEYTSETQSQTVPSVQEDEHPVTEVPEETAPEITETMPVSEETESVSTPAEQQIIFKGARLIQNPAWSEESHSADLVWEGSEYIYTVPDPDRYLVQLLYNDTSENFSLVRILNLRIVTIDDLVKAGLPYSDRKLK